MDNRKINLFPKPNCYADDYNNNTVSHLLIVLSGIISAVKKYWKHRFQLLFHCNSLGLFVYLFIQSKYLCLIYFDPSQLNLQILAETLVSKLSSVLRLATVDL